MSDPWVQDYAVRLGGLHSAVKWVLSSWDEVQEHAWLSSDGVVFDEPQRVAEAKFEALHTAVESLRDEYERQQAQLDQDEAEGLA